jgi:hypothetical protein
VARFLLIFPDATRLPYAPTPKENTHTLNREPYELGAIAKHLPSLPWTHEDTKLASFVDAGIQNFNEGKEDAKKMVKEDALFEATRHHLYRRAYAEHSTDNITEDYVQILLETENQLLAKPKGRGDIKSKAKRMAEYMQNEFVIYENIQGYAEWGKEQRNAYMREYRRRKGADDMGRTEHMKKVHKNRNAKAQAKIRGVLEDMFVREQIHFKNGKIRIGEVAKLVDMTAETVSKHLKEMGFL